MSDTKRSIEMTEKAGTLTPERVRESDVVFTPEEEQAVLRKLDYRLLPLLFVLYSLSVLDRSNLGNAKLAGMEDDIDLKNGKYEWLGTVFYIACMFTTSLTWLRSCFYRHSVPMDYGRMEAVLTPRVVQFCSFLLGIRGHHPGRCHQLGRIAGLSRLPRHG